jgi:hypothetical protein
MTPANDNTPPIEERIVDPRELAVRFSRLKLMALSPAHYFAACQQLGADDTLALRLGSGVHAMILNQPVVRYSGRRVGDKWDGFAAEHAGKVILNDREWAEASAMARAILRHSEAPRILFDGTRIEEPILWRYLGRSCSSRPDARGRWHLAELKTARTSKPGWFSRDVFRMHYHAQCAFYDEAHAYETSERFANVYIVAVEKTPPHPVTIYRLTDRALNLGHKSLRLWMEMLLACEADHSWPSYAESIVDLDAPDESGPIEIEIDGKLTEVT